MPKIIYLDNGSTTKVYPEVVNEMNKYLLIDYGNPGSPNKMGEEALNVINECRKKIASELGCKDKEIIFTSGATESNNLALYGIVNANKDKSKNKILISKIEHSSIYEPAMELRRRGYFVKEIGVDKNGLLDMDELEREVDDKTLLVSIVHGNNEIGVVQNLSKIGKICKKKRAIFHADCAQSLGKVRIKAKDFGIDILSACAHKIHGPKGVGLLFVREGIEIKPLMLGGGQEKGMRPGTENVAGIAGFTKALDIIGKSDKNKEKDLRDYFMEELERIGGKINGSKEERLYNNINVCFTEFDADEIVLKLSLKGVMCSSRSACLSKQIGENRVLSAIGLNEEQRKGSLRFVLSEFNTKKEIDYVVKMLSNIIKF
ncbi:MAG: cysteine desulfurase family protein [Nanoarchaeota archaeon]|nr:cysteine desulfurase family protein [Nanoarchaeota archaeon]